MKTSFIISGSSNQKFAVDLSKSSNISLGKITTGRFSNGEAKVRIEEEIYGNTFYVVQSLSQPVDEHIMELCLIVDALKRGGAEKIVAVVPWFGYGVQDKVFMPGEALSSKVVIDFLETVGVHSLVTVDLHSDNIIGFFEIPVVHVTAVPLFAAHVVKKYGKDVLVVSPDFGGAKRTRRFAKEMGQEGTIGIIDKERSLTTGEVELRGINLDVKDKIVVIPDDFISTGSTMVEVIPLLKKAGAAKVIACITHPILAKDAAKNIAESELDALVVTDSILIDDAKKNLLGDKLEIISTIPLLTPYLKI
jgi:ribose-phosphate pyrophosphokinase